MKYLPIALLFLAANTASAGFVCNNHERYITHAYFMAITRENPYTVQRLAAAQARKEGADLGEAAVIVKAVEFAQIAADKNIPLAKVISQSASVACKEYK